MRVHIDIEAGLFQALLVRCQEESVDFNEVVTAWLKRASRQPRTVMPGVAETRGKVLEMNRERT